MTPPVKAAFERYLAMRHELGRDAKPVCLMDMGTIGAKWLKKNGVLTGLDESEEINACTVKVKVDVNGHDEDWLFLFKNETHNHPTEIDRSVARPPASAAASAILCPGRSLRVSGDARHRRRGPDRAGLRDAGRQAPPAPSS